MSSSHLVLNVAGQQLLLHPERAVVWLERGTVIVADTHFGKSAFFRAQGLAVPVGTDGEDRARLLRLVREVEARHLIVLGDFLHAPLDPLSRDARDLEQWSDALLPAQLHVVAGNHDRGASRRWQPPFDWRDQDWLDGPFRFTHDADRPAKTGVGLFTLSGHVHPVVRLGGLRKHGQRVPVFWRRGGGLILPAFGLFTGGYAVSAAPGDEVFAVGPERVVQFR